MNWVCSLAFKGTLDDCARSELNEINPTLGKSKALSGLPSFSLMTWRVCAASVAYSSLAPSSSRSALGAPPANGISLQNLSCSNNLFYSASKCHLQTCCEFCYCQDLILKSHFKIQLSISFHFPKQHTLKKIIIPPQFWSMIAQIGLISLGKWAIFISLFSVLWMTLAQQKGTLLPPSSSPVTKCSTDLQLDQRQPDDSKIYSIT